MKFGRGRSDGGDVLMKREYKLYLNGILKAIEELKQRLSKRFGGDIKIFLFGSVVRGEHTSDSDIDILVLLNRKVSLSMEEEIFDIAYEVELKYDVIFGIIVYSMDFWESPLAKGMPLHKSIEREGIRV